MIERIKEIAEQAHNVANDGFIPDIKIPNKFIGYYSEKLINDILYEVREIVEHKVSYELADEIEAKVKAIYGVE